MLEIPIIIGSYPILDDNYAQTTNPYPNPMATNGFSTNMISQQPTAPQFANQGNYNTLPYPNAPTAPIASSQFPNDGNWLESDFREFKLLNLNSIDSWIWNHKIHKIHKNRAIINT